MSIQRGVGVCKVDGARPDKNARSYKSTAEEDELDVGSDVDNVEL